MRSPPAKWFYGLLSAALVAFVAEEALGGIWRMHTGELFPDRHLPFLPLLPAPSLLVYWGLLLLGSALLLWPRTRRAGEWVALAGAVVQCSQQYSNHHFLLVLVLFYLVALPEKWKMLRWQLVIVYGFSVIHKLRAGFYTGAALANLYEILQPPLLPSFLFGAAGSVAVLVVELLIPVLLGLRPRIGLWLLIGFHAALALLMPELVTFGLLMAALGVLFLEPRPA